MGCRTTGLWLFCSGAERWLAAPVTNVLRSRIFGDNMTRVRLAICLRVFALFSLTSGHVRAQNRRSVKPATIGSLMGATITEEEAKKAAAQQMQRLELQHLQAEANYARARHQALAEGLARVIEDKVLDAEAWSRGITTHTLLEKELAGKIKEPTMEDLKAHYPPDQVPAAVPFGRSTQKRVVPLKERCLP